MKNEAQHNIQSPNRKYTLLFGRVEEYSMGGAYACPIYLHELNENMKTLHAMCANKPIWNVESTIVYFPVWFSNDKVAKHDVIQNKTSLYEKLFSNIDLIKLIENKMTIDDYDENMEAFDIRTETILIEDYKLVQP
jgi:hypothetical protein